MYIYILYVYVCMYIYIYVLYKLYIIYTLWLFNIAMENDPFIDDVAIKMVMFHGYVK